MKAAITFSIALHWINKLVAFFIKGTTCSLEVITRLCEIIIIDEIIACIIGWINVNHFDTTEIGFAKDFEDIEVIALDIQIFRGVEVNRFFTTRTQSFINRLVGKTGSRSLIRPRELIAFFAIVEHIVRQFRTELVEVDSQLRLAILI